jgi:hypothetical protein
LANPRFDDSDYWTGLDRKTLGRLLPRLARWAEQIESINSKPFRALLAETSRATLLALPEDLRRYRHAIADFLREVSRRTHFTRQVAIAALVQHVVDRTRRFHDERVAALVAAVCDDTYSADAHKQWRVKNYKRLAAVLDQTRLEHSPDAPRESPPAGWRSNPKR